MTSTAAVFDENYYLTNNADVVLAISQGQFANALAHYSAFGGKELRQPNATFNPSYYAINNADVLSAVSAGGFANVFAHYQEFGETESRAPSINFAGFDSTSYLAANADVAAAVTAGQFASALDHFITFGQNESRTGSGVSETAVTGTNFDLTSSGDTLTGTANNDTFTGVFGSGTAADNTMSAGDSLTGGDGTDALNLTVIGATAGAAVATSGIENITISDIAGATFNSILVSDNPTIAFTNTLNGQTSTVNNAGLASTYSIAGQGDMTIDYLSTAGSSDTAILALAGAGSSSNSVTVNAHDTNTIEAMTVATSGSNFATIQGGTGSETVTITGDGTNALTITGDPTLTINGSATTGANNYIMGTTFGSGDTVSGGSSTSDELSLTVGSAGQTLGTTSGIEKVDVDFTAAGILNMTNMSGVTTIEISNDAVAPTISSMGADLTSFVFNETTARTANTALTFASTNSADVTITVGATDSTSTNVAVDIGDITMSNASGAVTLSSIGEADNAIDALSIAAATSLNVGSSTKGITQTGNLTATAVASMTVTADADSVSLGTVTSDADVTSVTLTASGAEANDITITNLDMDHVDAITATATDGADITISTLSFDDLDNDGATDNQVSVILNATSASSKITVSAIATPNVADAKIDSLTLTGAGDIDMDDADMGTNGAEITILTAAELTGQLDLDIGAATDAMVVTLGNAATGHTNTIITGAGNDVITGGTGADSITTGMGDDTITTGAGGINTISGGAGADAIDISQSSATQDTVVFLDGATANGVDTVTGFVSGTDKLDLQAMTDANSAVTTVSGAFQVIDNEIYFVDGSASANSADSATAAAAVIITASGAAIGVDDQANTREAYFVIKDDDNTGVYHYVNNNIDGSNVAAAELTLVGTIDAQLVATDIVA